MANERLVKVVLSNRTTLLNGFKGPDFSVISLTPEELLKNIDEVKPTPIFKYASNIVRAITRDEVLRLLKLEKEVEAPVPTAEPVQVIVEPTEPVLDTTPVDTVPPVEENNQDNTDATPVDTEEPTDEQKDVDGDVEKSNPTPTNTTQFKKNRR